MMPLSERGGGLDLAIPETSAEYTGQHKSRQSVVLVQDIHHVQGNQLQYSNQSTR